MAATATSSTPVVGSQYRAQRDGTGVWRINRITLIYEKEPPHPPALLTTRLDIDSRHWPPTGPPTGAWSGT